MQWLSVHPSNREQMIMQQTDSQYLNPTAIIDSDHPQELPFLGSDYTGFALVCEPELTS
jgi:hypothetical protein